MRRLPVTVSPTDSLVDLMYKMIRDNIGAVIVAEKGQTLGMITERDILKSILSNEKDLYTTKAGEIMSKPLLSIEADSTTRQALELMRKHKVRRLAITENGTLVGIITERRLFAGILSAHV